MNSFWGGCQTAGRLYNNLTGRREAPAESGQESAAVTRTSFGPQDREWSIRGASEAGNALSLFRDCLRFQAKNKREFVDRHGLDLEMLTCLSARVYPNTQFPIPSLIGLSDAPCLGRDRGDDVVFTETDGHSALLAAHDGPEDADASAFWIPERFTGVIGQEQFEPYFRAFRQGDIRMKVGPSGADVCRPESDVFFFWLFSPGSRFSPGPRDRSARISFSQPSGITLDVLYGGSLSRRGGKTSRKKV